MAVSFIGAAITYNANANSLALTPHADTAVGDLVIAYFAVSDGGAILTGGVGFSTETSVVGSDSQTIVAAFYKVMAAAGDIAEYTFTSTKNGRITLGMVTLRGITMVDPLPDSATWQGSTTGTTANAPSVTATVDGSLLLCAFVAHVEDGAWSTPTGMTEVIDGPYSAASGNPWCQLGVDVLAVDAGATGVKTAAVSAVPSDRPVAISIIAAPPVVTGAALFFGINT